MKKLIQTIKTHPLDLVILLTVSLLYQLNNHWLKWATSGIVQAFLICYLNDLMAPLFMLSYSNLLLGIVDRRITRLPHILLFCLVIGGVWEFFAPLIKQRAVWDPFDILCYLIGGAAYWLLQNRKVIFQHDKR